MRNFLAKLLLGDVLRLERVDDHKLFEWLFTSYANDGWKQYYTMRKKYIANLMGNGLGHEDYLISLGRLQELRSLNENISKEFARRKKLEEKEKKKKKPKK